MEEKRELVNKAIEKDVYMGKIPVLTEERIYNFKGVSFTTAGIGVASWCYVQGGWMASVLPVNLAILACIIPLLVVGLIMLFITVIPTKLGVDNNIIMSTAFGTLLAKIIFIITILTGAGWYAINAKIFATSFANLLSQLGYSMTDTALPWIATICLAIGVIFAIRGPQVVKISLYIMVPSLVGIGILLLIKTMMATSWEELMSITPIYADLYPSTKMAFLIMVEGMFAFGLCWYPLLGQFSRLADSRKSSYWGHAIGFLVAMAFFCIIGVLTATLMAARGIYSDNPTDWMITTAGPIWGVLSLIAIALANISTQITGLYCWSLSTKTFWTKFNFKAIAYFWSAYCVVLVFWDGIWTYYNVFLAVIGLSCGMATAIVLADYFFVRKSKFSLRSIYQIKGNSAYKYTHGFNMVAVTAIIAGTIIYYMAYDPINYVARNELLVLLTPTGTSGLVTFLVYIGLSKIPVINKYLTKDREEIASAEDRKLDVR